MDLKSRFKAAKDKLKKTKASFGKKARTAKQKAALKAAQAASAAKRKGKRAIGKAEAKGGRASKLIKKAGLSQRSSTGSRKMSGRKGLSKLNKAKGLNSGPSTRSKGSKFARRVNTIAKTQRNRGAKPKTAYRTALAKAKLMRNKRK